MERGDFNSNSSFRSSLFLSLAGQDKELDQLMDKTDLDLSQLRDISAAFGEDEEETGGNVFEEGRQMRCSSLDDANVNSGSGQVPSPEEFTRDLMRSGVVSLNSTRQGPEETGTGSGILSRSFHAAARGRIYNVSSTPAATPRRVAGTSVADRSPSHPGSIHSPERSRSRLVTDVTNHSQLQQVGEGSSNDQTQRGGRKRVRAEMVVKDSEVVLEIRGLDTWGIDPTNIKCVDYLDAEEVEEEEGQGSCDGLKRLKIVSLPGKEKNFRTDGAFGEKFRQRYTAQEDTAILTWLEAEKERQNGEIRVKGNRIWKRLEESEVCPGRSWHSLKQQWKKYLKNNSE